MPWSYLTKKAVVSCEKPRGGANIPEIRGWPNGVTRWSMNTSTRAVNT